MEPRATGRCSAFSARLFQENYASKRVVHWAACHWQIHSIFYLIFMVNTLRASQNIMWLCETDTHPTRDVLWISYLHTTCKSFVLIQVLPNVHGRKYKHNYWWHQAPCHRCTLATWRQTYATTASWQLLQCGKNTQFFHEGVFFYAHNTFKRVTQDIVLTEKRVEEWFRNLCFFKCFKFD